MTDRKAAAPKPRVVNSVYLSMPAVIVLGFHFLDRQSMVFKGMALVQQPLLMFANLFVMGWLTWMYLDGLRTSLSWNEIRRLLLSWPLAPCIALVGWSLFGAHVFDDLWYWVVYVTLGIMITLTSRLVLKRWGFYVYRLEVD